MNLATQIDVLDALTMKPLTSKILVGTSGVHRVTSAFNPITGIVIRARRLNAPGWATFRIDNVEVSDYAHFISSSGGLSMNTNGNYPEWSAVGGTAYFKTHLHGNKQMEIQKTNASYVTTTLPTMEGFATELTLDLDRRGTTSGSIAVVVVNPTTSATITTQTVSAAGLTPVVLNFTAPPGTTVELRIYNPGDYTLIDNLHLTYDRVVYHTVCDNSKDYRFGFNGQEKDNEVSGLGNKTTAEFWMYDSRLGRRWNVDPVVDPSESPFATNKNNPVKYNDPNGDCSTCPTGGGLKFNYSLGGRGLSASIYWGISAKKGFAMTGLNASLTVYRGGAGTSKSSPNLLNLTLSPSLTFGYQTAAPMSLNLFNDMSGTGVNNPFKNSFTFGGNMVFSSGTNSDGSGRSQWLGAASFRVGNFSMGSYNDTWKPPLFMGQNSDQFWSAGLNAQIQFGDFKLKGSNDLYYGMSNNKAKYSDDRIINGQNYDNQRLFDMMLNNGRENITLSSGRFGIMQSGTRSGYQTFYPSNARHSSMSYLDPKTGGYYSFHHLFVPYPNTQERTIQYLEGKTP